MNDLIQSLVNQAAFEGDIPLLATNREWWDVDTCEHAAMNGQLECLKFLHTQGCEWNSSTCSSAAGTGKLDCLKYAVESGCPLNVKVHECAAMNGQLECLKYAYEHLSGEHIHNYSVCVAAISADNLECLKFAISKTRKVHRMWISILWVAIRNAKFDCFKYLYKCYVDPRDFCEDPEEVWESVHQHLLEDKNKVEELYDKFDLDDEWWRRYLFPLRLSKAPTLLERVNKKKREIQQQYQDACKAVLMSFLPDDVIHHVLFPYISF